MQHSEVLSQHGLVCSSRPLAAQIGVDVLKAGGSAVDAAIAADAAHGKPAADIEQGHISTASCIMAILSQKLGRTLAWDAQAGRMPVPLPGSWRGKASCRQRSWKSNHNAKARPSSKATTPSTFGTQPAGFFSRMAAGIAPGFGGGLA
jgi:hypothetical protein